jgi:hypothetical protein
MNRRALRWNLGLATALAVSSAVTSPVIAHAQGIAIGRAAPVAELADDFNGDGYSDAAVPVPSATVGGKAKAGYVAVMYGSSTGLKASTKQVFHQDSAGIPAVSRPGTRTEVRSPPVIWTATGTPIWSSALPARMSAPSPTRARSR